jgi:hypothetical protein
MSTYFVHKNCNFDDPLVKAHLLVTCPKHEKQVFEYPNEWVPITGHVLNIVLLAEDIVYGELKCGCRESYAANITEEFILSIQGDDDED